eukprot:515347-Pelagomonas_calceolata.AAC.7
MSEGQPGCIYNKNKEQENKIMQSAIICPSQEMPVHRVLCLRLRIGTASFYPHKTILRAFWLSSDITAPPPLNAHACLIRIKRQIQHCRGCPQHDGIAQWLFANAVISEPASLYRCKMLS